MRMNTLTTSPHQTAEAGSTNTISGDRDRESQADLPLPSRQRQVDLDEGFFDRDRDLPAGEEMDNIVTLPE
jgi:hypothetical protein